MALSWAAPVWHLEARSASQEAAGTGHVSHQEETVSTVRSPLMPRERGSRGVLLGYEKRDCSLLARGKGKPLHFRDVAVTLA